MAVEPVVNIGARVVVSSAIFVTIAGIFLGLRIYTRARIVKSLGLDDFVVCFSWLLSVALTVCIGYEYKYGLGQHIQYLPDESRILLGKTFLVSIIFYSLSFTAVKASILLQYKHLFATTWIRVASYVILFVVIGRGLSAFFGTIFACQPTAYFWDRSIQGGTCIDLTALWYVNASIDIMTDVCIIVLPMPIIWTLNISRKQKIMVLLIFLLGGFGCVTSVLRLRSLGVVLSTTDISYNNTSAAMWSTIETNTAILCACIGTLKSFIMRYFPRIFQQKSSDLTNMIIAMPEKQQSFTDTTIIHAHHHPSMSETVTSTYTATRKKSSLATSPIFGRKPFEDEECMYHAFMMDMVTVEGPMEEVESPV